MTTNITSVLEARTKLNNAADSQPLDVTISALVRVQNPTTIEEMTVRVALIESIDRRYPKIQAWVDNFFDVDFDHPNSDLDMVDAIMLARHKLGL